MCVKGILLLQVNDRVWKHINHNMPFLEEILLRTHAKEENWLQPGLDSIFDSTHPSDLAQPTPYRSFTYYKSCVLKGCRSYVRKNSGQSPKSSNKTNNCLAPHPLHRLILVALTTTGYSTPIQVCTRHQQCLTLSSA